MAINTQRVLLGGLAAGVVLNIIDGAVNGFILKDRMRADGNAFKAGFGDQMAVMDPTAIFTYIGLGLRRRHPARLDLRGDPSTVGTGREDGG